MLIPIVNRKYKHIISLMVLALVIFALTIIMMISFVIMQSSMSAFKKVAFPLYLIPVVLGAICFLCFGVVPLEDVISAFTSSSAVNPIKILLLFLSMSFLSIYLDEVGFFHSLASWAIKKFNKGQMSLFVGLYILISVLTIFTSNDIVILTFTPFICSFCKRANISPIPYLVMEFIAANTYSMLFIIGNPTNIFIATFAEIDFLSYLSLSYLPTIFAGLTSFVVLLVLFRKKLSDTITVKSQEEIHIKKASMIISLSCLGVAIIMMTISSYVGLEMYIVSIICFASLALIEALHGIKQRISYHYLLRSITRLPYEVIPLLISMFILVLGLGKCGFNEILVSFLDKGHPVWMYGIASSLFDNLMNNIPMSVLFASLSSNSLYIKEATFASIIGSNLGAFLTPIGALAGIMFLGLVKKEGVSFSFLDFCKYGAIIFVFTLPMALLGLTLVTL